MAIRVATIAMIGALIGLGVLGHHEWHGAMVTILNLVVNLFTGAHVTG